MRKHTFEDRKFSQGNANSSAFRDNWDSIFGDNEKVPDCSAADLPSESPETRATSTEQTESADGCAGVGAH